MKKQIEAIQKEINLEHDALQLARLHDKVASLYLKMWQEGSGKNIEYHTPSYVKALIVSVIAAIVAVFANFFS